MCSQWFVYSSKLHNKTCLSSLVITRLSALVIKSRLLVQLLWQYSRNQRVWLLRTPGKQLHSDSPLKTPHSAGRGRQRSFSHLMDEDSNSSWTSTGSVSKRKRGGARTTTPLSPKQLSSRPVSITSVLTTDNHVFGMCRQVEKKAVTLRWMEREGER